MPDIATDAAVSAAAERERAGREALALLLGPDAWKITVDQAVYALALEVRRLSHSVETLALLLHDHMDT